MYRKKSVVFVGILVLLAILFYLVLDVNRKEKKTSNYKSIETVRNDDGIENGIHINTGLADAEGLPLVIAHCTSCHSAKLITQNRLSKEGWQEAIKWMQETQNLWDLGDDEAAIIAYLTKNYAPTAKGRREVLNDIEWYVLED